MICREEVSISQPEVNRNCGWGGGGRQAQRDSHDGICTVGTVPVCPGTDTPLQASPQALSQVQWLSELVSTKYLQRRVKLVTLVLTSIRSQQQP